MSGPCLLGCIADDFTGATDLASMLVSRGMRTVQTIGVPRGGAPVDADAVVVALKSRTIPPAEAVRQSLEALAWLRAQGVRQVYFKYCSTFDSTDAGNIGPVADALLDALGGGFTIACPALPANKRTVYQGYLFVGDVTLSDSPMRNHPLTPMTDANLVRVLGRQTKRKVGPGALERRAARRRRDPRAFRRLARGGHDLRGGRRDRGRGPGRDRRSVRGPARSSPRGPASRSGCRRTSAGRDCSPSAATPPCCRRSTARRRCSRVPARR